jgi:hypothetical protein
VRDSDVRLALGNCGGMATDDDRPNLGSAENRCIGDVLTLAGSGSVGDELGVGANSPVESSGATAAQTNLSGATKGLGATEVQPRRNRIRPSGAAASAF